MHPKTPESIMDYSVIICIIGESIEKDITMCTKYKISLLDAVLETI